MVAKKRNRRRQSKHGSWIGNILLELIAVSALLFVVFTTSGVDRAKNEQRASYPLTSMGMAITDFVNDQIDYHDLIEN